MNRYLTTPLARFRLIALLEGISFIVLLTIAMPLKYIAHIPQVVKYNGWIHGVLFILYILFLIRVKEELNWSFKKSIIAFIASLIPFGTFVLDNKWLKPLPEASSGGGNTMP